MSVIFEPGYFLPQGDEPLTHARIAHAGTWVDDWNASATSTADGFFVDGPNDSLTYEYWSPTTLPATWTLQPMGVGQEVTADYCCIAAHTLGTAASNLTLTIEYLNPPLVSPSVWNPIISNASISDDSPIFAIFRPVTAIGFRITINGTTAPRIGVVRFGQALQMPQPLYAGHTPLILSRQTTMRSNKSTTGEFLGRTRLRNARSTEIGWTHLRADWVREYWLPFQFAMEQDPFFLAWRPITFPNDVGYCYVDGGSLPAPTNSGPRDFMNVSMNIIARGYD